MLRPTLIAVSLATLFSLAHTTGPSCAQAPAVPDAVLSDMRASIVRAIGAQDETVKITIERSILTVLRVNSNVNETTHGARDNEATVIASMVSKAISGKSKFNNLHTIRVQYAVRPATNANSRIIDTIDFRKDPQGVFQLHRT